MEEDMEVDGMNETEAEIIVMKDLLIQCERTISFLRNCLLDTKGIQYKYTYPENEVSLMQKLQKNYKGPHLCHHSHFVEECKDCREGFLYRFKLNEAIKILDSKE